MLINSRKYDLTDIEARSLIQWSDFVTVDAGGDSSDDAVKIVIGGTSPDDPFDKSTVTLTKRELNAINRTLDTLYRR